MDFLQIQFLDKINYIACKQFARITERTHVGLIGHTIATIFHDIAVAASFFQNRRDLRPCHAAIGHAMDQQHRLTVSGFDVASGMKNPTSGDFSVMLNSVYAAQHPHHFVYRGYEVETTGNPLTHVVLRGAVSKHGNSTQNYHYEDLIRLCDMYAKMDLVNPAAIIDANHSNSGKQFKEQIRIVKEVMHNRQLSQDIHNMVKGVMIESYIEEGSQKIHDHIYGKSITDPCLGWEDSKKLIYDIAEMCK